MTRIADKGLPGREVDWIPPDPPAARERREERVRLAQSLAEKTATGRPPVKNPEVLEAIHLVPRHVFVPRQFQDLAYEDCPLPLAKGQTISQPYIVATMTELLGVTDRSRILEIGTGSGYQTAVLAQLTPHVFTIEFIEDLAERARTNLSRQGYEGIHFRTGDGFEGWPEAAPFDGIIATCCTRTFPTVVWDQLRPGGRIVLPMGDSADSQWLMMLEKASTGTHRAEAIMPVRFVPRIGEDP